MPDEPGRPRRALRWLRRRLAGIRLRIVFAYVVLLGVALITSITVTRHLVLQRLDDEIDDRLTQETQELRQLAGGVDPTTSEPFGDDVKAILDTFLDRNVPDDHEAFYTVLDGRPYESSYNADTSLYFDAELFDSWRNATVPTWSTDETSLGEVRTLTVPIDGGDQSAAFVVAYFPEDEREDALTAIRLIAIAGAVVLVLTALVAWSVADRVLLPIRRLTSTAKTVSDSRLSERIPVEGHDELAELGTTFNAMIERLEQSFEYQRQFLDDVAHELRTPITIARGNVELLGDTPAERDEAAAIISDELDRMARYVSDLLVLAKAGRPDFLRLDPVDLGDLANSFLQRVRSLGDRRWVLDEAPPPGTAAVAGDEERLNQAAVNLATNAVQHTTSGDEIGIGVRTLGDTYHLWVRDTGPGIDETVLDRLFDRYTRGATSRTRRADGLGIGLSIVDAIAAAHGGSVAAANTGDGAIITVTCAADPEATTTTPQETV